MLYRNDFCFVTKQDPDYAIVSCHFQYQSAATSGYFCLVEIKNDDYQELDINFASLSRLDTSSALIRLRRMSINLLRSWRRGECYSRSSQIHPCRYRCMQVNSSAPVSCNTSRSRKDTYFSFWQICSRPSGVLKTYHGFLDESRIYDGKCQFFE